MHDIVFVVSSVFGRPNFDYHVVTVSFMDQFSRVSINSDVLFWMVAFVSTAFLPSLYVERKLQFSWSIEPAMDLSILGLFHYLLLIYHYALK